MDHPSLSPTWHKSSYSGQQENCVEVAHLDRTRAVRDSKRPVGPVLLFSSSDWQEFIAGVKRGDFV
ncbi:DUF397 domain-containing protein [Sphaerisporangium dianthi]|uniref:DUF397 domain-containing protein n=1 Tax=Sphaerisporangium dianthi TaxID=1436120 RepID=A0ABV9CFL0_9ACTN